MLYCILQRSLLGFNKTDFFEIWYLATSNYVNFLNKQMVFFDKNVSIVLPL